MNKAEIRKFILSKRNKLKDNKIKIWSEKIAENLMSSEIYMKAKSIFIYIGFGSEVNTISIINDALKCGKEVYVPKTDKKNKEMKAIRIHNLDNMIVDKWGVLVPRTVDKNKIGESFDLIIMPGVAFDTRGNRIGYGGGYYDKYICSYEGDKKLIALAYNLQIVKCIENEEHDIKVNYIITEKEFMNYATISGNYFETLKSNEVKTIIEYNSEEHKKPQDTDNLENPDYNPEQGENKEGRYIISGSAWVDKNENGQFLPRFRNYTSHMMNFFYLERGWGSSNCKIQFI